MDYFAEVKSLSSTKYFSESEAMAALAPYFEVFQQNEAQIFARARKYLQVVAGKKPGLVQSLISQYPLKTEQGQAIMSLAECLDRVPDKKTAYQLIDDKLKNINWSSGEASLMMSAAGQALGLASKLGGNAVTYTALHSAFKILGREFILGNDIKNAISHAKSLKKQGYSISYDMLGEGARTSLQAENYLKSYLEAAASAEAKSADIFENDSISVKISALHPRYELLKYEQLRTELLPRLLQIVQAAKKRNIAVIIDAEEAARLDLSLLIFAELFVQANYEGLGLAVQAYQKAALPVLKFLQKLSAEKGLRIPVRLVKGAYWDYEIKRAQADGLSDYPVYTQKDLSDISYLACAKFMLENSGQFYPQFATHNVITISSLLEVIDGEPHEFQKLFGMGDEIYDDLIKEKKIKCRVYAPVGEQEDLLPYLIRRLLENGANNSFVHQLANARTSPESVLHSPFAALEKRIALRPPGEIYSNRKNSSGVDLGSVFEVENLKAQLAESMNVVISESNIDDCDRAVKTALQEFESWSERDISERAAILENIADNFELNTHKLAQVLTVEAKRNIADSLSEIRETVDFCRYYAVQARSIMRPRKMAGITGEDNIYQLEPRGVFVCISPWNFPLSIFTGQIAAALVSGNCVIAKPAEQTPKVAALAVKLMQEAGLPEKVLQLIIGNGETVGAQLVANPEIAGVCFTGSTATARVINKTLAEKNSKIVPLIAETGGQNCMIVDSTALIERAVDDMIVSAFGSVGQRCSALRVAYVQSDIADELLNVLKGAMAEITLGNTQDFATDVGEVIDAEAKSALEKHIERMKSEAKLVYACGSGGAGGNFVPPHLFEIKSISQLPTEVFGPVLHVIRYKDFDEVIAQVNSTGYGLTFGIQTRIFSRIDYLSRKIHAGNIYANRSMIGAVVESQPFGGHGLSGTGPKAGGPEYLKRFCVEKVVTINKTAIGGNLELL